MKTKEINFPVIKKPLPDSRPLSMNDYLRFVSFNLKYAFNRGIYRKWKKTSAVNIPFVLKSGGKK